MAMAACSCSLQCQPLRCGAAEASAGRTARGRSSFSEHQQIGRPRNFGGEASVVCRVGNGRAGAGLVVGRKEHLGRSLRLLEVVALPEGQHYSKAPGLKVEAAKRVDKGRSFALSSTLVVAEDKEEEAKALCHEILKWGNAKKVFKPNSAEAVGSFMELVLWPKKERGSGVKVFECNADPFDKNTYHFWELYDSFQFMNDIRSSPEHTKFVEEVRPLLVQPIGLAAYEYKDGKIGHMLNPIGPKGEGGLDDATGQSGTKQQSSSIGQGLGEMEEDMGSKAWGLDKLLAKVRGEDKEAGWSFKTLFGDPENKAKL